MSDENYIAVIDQDEVTDEVKQIALNYDPVNRSGGEGFHVDDECELHIDNDKVMEAHKIIEHKINGDAIRIIPLASKTGQLIHEYGENGFSLYGLPLPNFDQTVGLIGENAIGKSTALKIVAGLLQPNFGDADGRGFEGLVDEYKGSEGQAFFSSLAAGDITVGYKPQQVDQIPAEFNGSVEDLLQGVDERGAYDEVVAGLDLDTVTERRVGDLSGGELQRVAIAATGLKDADLYLFDEPTSYLDITQRIKVSRFIRYLTGEDEAVMVIEHDLIVLDFLTDLVHVMYGESNAYGVTSQVKASKQGINEYLDGYLSDEHVKFRDEEITFDRRSEQRYSEPSKVTAWSSFSHEYESFRLDVEEGSIFEKDVIGVLGENGIGKSTMMKALSGEIETDATLGDVDISYKPQHLESDDTLVRLYLEGFEQFRHSVINPLSVEPLLDKTLNSLSGGQLQRVKIAKCLLRDADVYLLDEPSAYLDVTQRLEASRAIRDVMERRETAAVVIDHDLLFLDYLANRLLVFDGEPGVRGEAEGPLSMKDGMNRFLGDLEVTFRRDVENNRPRINKPGSQKDKEQKRNGEYYYT